MLPIFNTPNKDFSMMQTRWSSELNPLLDIPMLKGLQLKNVSLVVGPNTINHRLDRALQGYIITGMHGLFAEIFDAPSPMPTKTLVLNSNVITSIDLWVY